MTENETATSAPTDDGETNGRLRVANVGGIAEGSVPVSRGVTLVSGRNASNKSSLLGALAGVLGGPVPPLKSDADGGSVHLDLDGESYSLSLERQDGETVAVDADPYSTADDCCDLFVALTETNPIRQAVVTDGDLYDLLLRPVDTEEIEAEISRLTAEKRSLDERLEELDRMEERLPGLRRRRASLEDEIDAVTADLRDHRERIEELEAETEATDDEAATELTEKRSERNDLQSRIRTNEEALGSLEDELEEVTERLADLRGGDEETTVADIEDELSALHGQKQQLTSTINALSPIVEMNTGLLDEGAAVPDRMTADEVVSELDPSSQSITCWTCGSTVERAQIAEQVETVREILKEKRNQRDAVTEQIQQLTERKRDIETRQAELDDVENRRDRVEAEIEERRETLADLRERRGDLESEIATLQERATEPEDGTDQLAEWYETVGDLEYERGTLSNDLERVESEIADIEAALEERPEIEAERSSVADALREQRERIDEIERTLVATFNEQMQEVLDALGYDAIERVWIERRVAGNGASPETDFDLHVVRRTEDGRAYDDTVANLSKSEREVIGLVVALAGYLAHDVDETVPFVVVDAVEMFDADRIRGLVEHFAQHARYVVAAVLPEERAVLADDYAVVSTASLAADP